MTTLITGGSKCGKSHIAEKLLSLTRSRKIYVATMQPYGCEAQEIIKRHLQKRSGKGFDTIEKYTDIHEISLPANCAVLLECVGNLCANEMFRDRIITYPSAKIINGIASLAKKTEDMIIVTNQVGSDGIAYEKGTADYISEMGAINSGIASFADNVIECVYGIPVMLKGELPC